MKTQTGIQGDETALNKARERRKSLTKSMINKDIPIDEKFNREDKELFIFTWQDSLSNLSHVLKHVKPKAPEIIAQKIDKSDGKGRRDVLILTEDNLKFKEVFYKTLEELKKQYEEA